MLQPARAILGLGCLAGMSALALGPRSAPADPTFADEIGPVIRRSCAPCHLKGGPAPFSLESYEDVRKRVRQISDDVGSYHMPPCNASSDFTNFCTYRGITDAEFVRFLEWKNEGMKPGDLSKLVPVKPSQPTWKMGPPDLVLVLAKGSQVPAGAAPFWRTIRVPLPANVSIRGFDIRPSSPPVVRHVLVSRAGRKRIDGDRAAGGPSVTGTRPSDLIGSWAVGYRPFVLSAGIGFSARSLDMEVQYQPTGRTENGDVQLALYFTKASKAQSPVWKSLGVADFTVPAYQDVTLRSEWRVDANTKLYAIEPEGGYFPATFTLILKAPSGPPRTAVKIDRWNPYWQGAYSFEKPVQIPKGTVVVATARFRNVRQDVHDFNHSLPDPTNLRSGHGVRAERFWFHLAIKSDGN